MTRYVAAYNRRRPASGPTAIMAGRQLDGSDDLAYEALGVLHAADPETDREAACGRQVVFVDPDHVWTTTVLSSVELCPECVAITAPMGY